MGKIRNLNEYDQGQPKERGKQKKKKVFESEPRHHIEFAPKTENQKLAWKYFREKDIIVLTGSAGVGKCLDYETEIEIFVSDELFDVLNNSSL